MIKKKKIKLYVLLFLSMSGSLFSYAQNSLLSTSDSTTAIQQKVAENLAVSYSAFIENKGQMTDLDGELVPDVFFKTEAPGINLFVTKNGLTYCFFNTKTEEEDNEKEENKEVHWSRIDMRLEGAKIKKENIELEGKSEYFNQYFFNHCPNGVLDVHEYTKITIKEIYPNVDWVLYNVGGKGFKYDFVVHPGGNPNVIELIYSSPHPVTVKENGDIEVITKQGKLTEMSPLSFADSKKIETNFSMTRSEKNEYGGYDSHIKFLFPDFELLNSQTLIIDPQLVWATLYGGNGSDGPKSTDCDINGNVYVTGYTQNTGGFPTQAHTGNLGAYYNNTYIGPRDVFILKFDNIGKRIWSTYYSVSVSWTTPYSVEIDTMGNIVIVGAGSIPTQVHSTNPTAYYNTTPNSGFIVQFDNMGNRIWATYYPGTTPFDVAIDTAGNIYVTGRADTKFVPQPFIASPSAYYQATSVSINTFILKFSNIGDLIWATYYDGAGTNSAHSIDIDGAGNIYVAGKTNSATFPVLPFGGGYYQSVLGGNYDAFVLRFNNIGVLTWATLYGGSSYETVSAIRTDALGNIYVTGYTSSTDLPTQPWGGAYYQPTNAGSNDQYLIRFNPSGTLTWATYYGGSGKEDNYSTDNLEIDQCGNVYLSFDVYSAPNDIYTFSGCSDYIDSTNNGGDLVYVKFNNKGVVLWSTYFGGDTRDFSPTMALDNQGSLFVAGEWRYPSGVASLPLLNPGGGAYYDNTSNGNDDGYVAKFILSPPPTIIQSQANTTSCSPCNGSATVTLNCGNPNYSYQWSNGIQALDTAITTHTISGLCPGTYWVEVTSNCNQVDTIFYTITGVPCVGCINSPLLTITSQTDETCFQVNGSITVAVNGGTGTAPFSYVWNNGDTTATITGLASGPYQVIVTDAGGCKDTLDVTLNNTGAATNGTDIITDCNPIVWLDGNTYSANNNTATYTITGGAANGCDSIVTLDFTLNNATSGTDIITDCNPIVWLDGNTYSANNNTATHTIVGGASNGCDSIVTLNFTLNSATNGTDVITDCNPIVWLDGNTYSANNNTATHTLAGGAANGCDSVVTLNFTLNSATNGTDVITDCNPIVWIDGNTYSANNNTATHTLVGGASNGCDSVVTLNFTLNSATNGTDVITDCNPIVWIDGNTYSANNNTATHTLTGGSANGCDSIVTLNFTLNSTTNGTDVITDCNPIVWLDGNTYSANNNTATHTIAGGSANGCDSIVTLNFTLNSTTNGTDVITDCNPIVWLDGNTYSANNNTATHTLVGGAANGCDSIVTLDFTLNTFASGTDVITDCNPIVWLDGNTYSASNNTATHTIVGGSVNGCDSIVTLDFALLPSYNMTENEVICSGDNYTYPDGTVSNNIIADENHVSNLTAVNGCDSIVTTNLSVELDSINFSYNPNSYCLTDSNPTPTNTGLLGGTYTIDNSGVINPTTGEVDITASGAGNYVITYTTNGSCPNSKAISFNLTNCITPLPVANFTTPNTTLCAGDCIDYTDLSTSSAGGITAWSWNFPGSNTPFDNNQHPTNICYNTPGTYPVALTVTDANGVNDTTFSSYITVNPCTLPTGGYIVSDSSICVGECVDFTDQSSDATSWQWTFNGGTPSTSTDQHPTDICFDTVGNYIITQMVNNTYGADTITSTITVNALPIINAPDDQTIDLGESTTLTTTGSTGSYQWTPPTNLDCSNCPNPIATPEETITYTVIVVDANGCTATDQVTVIVDYETVIYVPNIFSPNGDGNNDILYVRGKGIRDFSFVVYDRWGEKVFETTDLNKGWNGVFRGEPMNKAVFVYYLKGTFVDGSEFEQKGDVTLIR